MPSTDDRRRSDDRRRFELAGVVALAVVALLYGVLVARAPLAWVGIALPLVALYLLWRLVRAHERIANALE